MDVEKKRVDWFPDQEARDKSIAQIIEKGMPVRQSLMTALPWMWKRVRLKGLLFGVEDCCFLALLLFVLLWGGIFICADRNVRILNLLLFWLSPFLYGLLHILSAAKQIMTGTYELLMTCRLSLRQMTVLRMLLFGGISLCLSTGTNLMLWLILGDGCSLLKMLGISFTSLFLFAWLELMAEGRGKAPLAWMIVPLLWCILGLILLLMGERALLLFRVVPTAVFLVLAVSFAFLYGRSLRNYYFKNREGAVFHAFSGTCD